MWEGNCCYPGKNFMHIAASNEMCDRYEPEMDTDEDEPEYAGDEYGWDDVEADIYDYDKAESGW